MSRKTVTDNLALALLILCAGVVGGALAQSSPSDSGRQALERGAGHSKGHVLLFEDFESPMTLAVDEGYAPVAYGTPNLGGSGAFWGRTVARAAHGLFSAWAAGDGWNSPSGGFYGSNCIPYYGGPCLVPRYTNATLTTAPVDLSPYTSGTLTYELWLDTEASDLFSVQASIDGVRFYGYTYYGSTPGGFMNREHQLTSWPVWGNLMGARRVWFRFGYSSDGSLLKEGAFVDSVTVEVDGGDLNFGDGFEPGDTSRWARGSR